MAGRVSNATAVAGVSVPASALAEEVSALDRAGAMLQASATLIAVTRRSLADRPPDPEMEAPQADASGVEHGSQGMQPWNYPAAMADKQFATLSALAARNGITLHALADGSFLMCKWGMSRALSDLCVVASLLRQMGVSV